MISTCIKEFIGRVGHGSSWTKDILGCSKLPKITVYLGCKIKPTESCTKRGIFYVSISNLNQN